MAFQLSPGVLVTEKDLTSIVPAVATTAGAFAGTFQWGPVEEVITIDSENNLYKKFGGPNDTTYKSFFTAANFLGYGNNLQVVRAANKGVARNAVALRKVSSALESEVFSIALPPGVAGPSGSSNANIAALVTLPESSTYNLEATVANVGVIVSGNAITGFTLANAGDGYVNPPRIEIYLIDNITGGGLFTGRDSCNVYANVTATSNIVLTNDKIVYNDDDYLNNHSSGNSTFGEFAAKYPGELGNSIRVSLFDSTSTSDFSAWTYSNSFRSVPGTSSYVSTLGGTGDELHVAVIDVDGRISGAAGTVIEKYAYVSKAADAKNADGSTNYYKDVINQRSEYIRWLAHPNYTGISNWGSTAKSNTFTRLSAISSGGFPNGIRQMDLQDGAQGVPSSGNLRAAYEIFKNDELYDVSLIPMGDANSADSKWVLDNVVDVRRDCLVFLSPDQSNVVYNSAPATNTVTYRNDTNINSSFAVMDSGWKYQYDRYNDVYRWVPLNGDTAGLCARTDFTNDPWFSPAGFSRGQIKNVVKLAYSPSKTDRDTLYKAEINPVVSFPGQGTILFGDKTMLSRPSAFDRINVRRLFIVLEKAIATAAKFQLFEFNDAFTRAQFRNLVEPFLRDVQGRRGINDFKVVCDETNNTAEVVDRNEFIADIFIKPARSINYIQLNFIATRSGISFEEVGA